MTSDTKCKCKWAAAGLVLAGVVAGVALVGVSSSVLHWAGSPQFCGTFCHSMDAAFDSYKKGQHYKTNSGYRAGCSDCHLKYESDRDAGITGLVGKLAHKAQAGTTSLIGEIKGTMNTKEKQIEMRDELGEAVQEWMKSTGYQTCRGCHDLASMRVNPNKPHVAPMHKPFATDKKADCIACHSEAGHKYED